MKVIRHDPATASRDEAPIFVGEVHRQPLVTDGDATLLRVTSVTFRDGARNRLHHHGADQVLVVTAGTGIVATEREEVRIEPGDVVLIPAGERHWHGAIPGADMTHLAILTPGEMTIDE
jgi:quercetin dioxygenase-like cupin family protein